MKLSTQRVEPRRTIAGKSFRLALPAGPQSADSPNKFEEQDTIVVCDVIISQHGFDWMTR